MVNFYEEAITPSCGEALALLSRQPFINEFYLAGGTALALQIGHRLSTDLDWFSSSRTLMASERERILGSINIGDQLRVLSEQDGMLYTRLLGTDVSFIFQQHPLLYGTITYRGVDLASPIDIGLMKLAAINSRGSRRNLARGLSGLK